MCIRTYNSYGIMDMYTYSYYGYGIPTHTNSLSHKCRVRLLRKLHVGGGLQGPREGAYDTVECVVIVCYNNMMLI